ncbi:hypothetical protein MtrunA17_Chr6g0458831 [Medicago truncatula]|uniref:Uncharacterized protein n=1 Tax=Medicago truncatula TaxID=3880 RepID=A0A396HH04_MEDTR|nr:hypothetical protein MtrunA17_Chr6g0458831 [Medicago truncatula]
MFLHHTCNFVNYDEEGYILDYGNFANYDEEGYILDYGKTINHLQAAAIKEFLLLYGVGKEESLQGSITYTSVDSNVEKETSCVVQTGESTTNGQENIDTEMSLFEMSNKNRKIFEP